MSLYGGWDFFSPKVTEGLPIENLQVIPPASKLDIQETEKDTEKEKDQDGKDRVPLLPPDELKKQPICRYFTLGCARGDSCKYAHVYPAERPHGIGYLCPMLTACPQLLCSYAHRVGEVFHCFNMDTNNVFRLILPRVDAIEGALRHVGVVCRCGIPYQLAGFHLNSNRETKNLRKRCPRNFAFVFAQLGNDILKGSFSFLCPKCTQKARARYLHVRLARILKIREMQRSESGKAPEAEQILS